MSGIHSDLTHWGQDKMDAISQDDIFKRIFFTENVWILLRISLKFGPKVSINDIPTLVQMMWKAIIWTDVG